MDHVEYIAIRRAMVVAGISNAEQVFLGSFFKFMIALFNYDMCFNALFFRFSHYSSGCNV